MSDHERQEHQGDGNARRMWRENRVNNRPATDVDARFASTFYNDDDRLPVGAYTSLQGESYQSTDNETLVQDVAYLQQVLLLLNALSPTTSEAKELKSQIKETLDSDTHDTDTFWYIHRVLINPDLETNEKLEEISTIIASRPRS